MDILKLKTNLLDVIENKQSLSSIIGDKFGFFNAFTAEKIYYVAYYHKKFFIAKPNKWVDYLDDDPMLIKSDNLRYLVPLYKKFAKFTSIKTDEKLNSRKLYFIEYKEKNISLYNLGKIIHNKFRPIDNYLLAKNILFQKDLTFISYYNEFYSWLLELKNEYKTN